jgi:phosphoglycolate phosphatase
MKYDLIVFDWDGTLYDSAAHIVTGVQESAKAMGLSIPTDKESRSVIGLSFNVALARLFPDLDDKKFEAFTTFYREWHAGDSGHARPVLFQGATDVLESLKANQYLTAVATGKGRKGLDADLEDFKVRHLFDATRCGDEGESKPHPEMLHIIMDELEVDPAKTLMIGDTEFDMALANNAGTDALAVSYGVHDEVDLLKHKPKHVIHDVKELLGFLGH